MIASNDLSGSGLSRLLASREQQEEAQATDILKYYLDNYSEVYTLICDKCKEKLAIEYVDMSQPNPNHHQGRQVIAISNKFKSYRPRLDGAMGYQCECGNDTKLAKIEDGIVPVAKLRSDGTLDIPQGGMELHPHHQGLVSERISKLNYSPDIRLKGKDTITETFRVRRLN